MEVPECGRFGLWPLQFVAVSVCDSFGFWTFRVWSFRFVAVMTRNLPSDKKCDLTDLDLGKKMRKKVMTGGIVCHNFRN